MQFFVGYDLGDGETSLHLLKGLDVSKKDPPDPILLPGRKNPGPIPIILARTAGRLATVGEDALSSTATVVEEFCVNFKHKPSTLIDDRHIERFLSQSERSKLDGVPPNWPQDPAWKKLTDLKDRVVEFTDAIFLNQRVSAFITNGTNKIDVFIGHPTTWTKIDVQLYRRIIEQTCLAKCKDRLTHLPLYVNLEMESRAAFLQTRASEKFKVKQLHDGAYAVVFDFGSSTADVTIVSGLDVDEKLKDEGDHSLGARLIDEGIFNYICGAMSEEDRNRFEGIKDNTLNYKERCIYKCRLAKEEYFSADPDARTGRSFGGSIKGFSIDDHLNHTAMQKILNTPQPKLENKSWIDASRQLFERVKRDMTKEGMHPEVVILTGGASFMDFVGEQCRKVFESEQCVVMQDPSPCDTISKGLALVARSDARAAEFTRKINEYCGDKLSSTIAGQVDSLADAIAPQLAELILDQVTDAVLKWRRGGYSTLASMEKNAITEAGKAITSDRGKQLVEKASKSWLIDKVLPAIDRDTKNICEEYGVRSLQLSDLARCAMAGIPNVSIAGFAFSGDLGRDLVQSFSSILLKVVAALAVVLSPIILPAVVAIVATIATVITGIIVAVLGAVAAVTPPVWPFIFLAVGVGLIAITIKGWKAVKADFMRKATTIEFPVWIREKLVSESDIRSKVQGEKNNVTNSIRAAIKNDKLMKERLGEQAAAEIKMLVVKAADLIRMRIRAE